jgi:hypothetical protein
MFKVTGSFKLKGYRKKEKVYIREKEKETRRVN